jgi:hypothetical protein
MPTKIILFIIAISIILAASTAIAEVSNQSTIPNGTVIIGDQAFDLTYLSGNIQAQNSVIVALTSPSHTVAVKISGKYWDAKTGGTTMIPEADGLVLEKKVMTYFDKDGNTINQGDDFKVIGIE